MMNGTLMYEKGMVGKKINRGDCKHERNESKKRASFKI